MTKSPSDDLDAHCAAIWNQIMADAEPQTEDLTRWTRNRLDTIAQALHDDRLARLRQQPVVSLQEYREAKGKEGGR